MITYDEIVVAMRQLPAEVRVALIEEVAHSLVTELSTARVGASSIQRVRGLLSSQEHMPNSSEIREDYTDYLIQKYS